MISMKLSTQTSNILYALAEVKRGKSQVTMPTSSMNQSELIIHIYVTVKKRGKTPKVTHAV